MANYKLTLCFDGTNYHGWQRQANALTIQELLEVAIKRMTKRETAVVGCSRTDAGGHARTYVCNFHSEMSVPCDKVPFALNTLLPNDITVLRCEPVSEDFHARFGTVAKEYCYQIDHAPHKNPFLRNFAYHFPYSLELDAMRRAACDIVGTHDFSAFMASGSDRKTTVRTVYSLTVEQTGELYTIRILADGYLYNMVRIIAGTLLYVGNGKIVPDSVADIITSRDRKQAGITAEPQGLFLTGVYYEREELV